MNSLSFSSVSAAIVAYRIAKAHGLYCVLNCRSIKFETEEDMEVASAILPSYNLSPR